MHPRGSGGALAETDAWCVGVGGQWALLGGCVSSGWRVGWSWSGLCVRVCADELWGLGRSVWVRMTPFGQGGSFILFCVFRFGQAPRGGALFLGICWSWSGLCVQVCVDEVLGPGRSVEASVTPFG